MVQLTGTIKYEVTITTDENLSLIVPVTCEDGLDDLTVIQRAKQVLYFVRNDVVGDTSATFKVRRVSDQAEGTSSTIVEAAPVTQPVERKGKSTQSRGDAVLELIQEACTTRLSAAALKCVRRAAKTLELTDEETRQLETARRQEMYAAEQAEVERRKREEIEAEYEAFKVGASAGYLDTLETEALVMLADRLAPVFGFTKGEHFREQVLASLKRAESKKR